MAVTPITEYAGDVPIIGQPQPTFNQNASDKLNYDKQLFGTDGEFNVAISEINQTASQVSSDASSASQSASDALASEIAAEVSASATGYQGLWPDSGGSAVLGDTYQTQVGGVPTGEYFSALKNTSVAPADDNENWRLLISTSSLEDSTKQTMNKYGLSGKAPVPSVVGDFDLITEENYHSLSITGTWNNTPFGDGVLTGGQLSILRRAFDTGAVIQELHLTNGDLYRRVGSGNPVVFGDWKKQLDDDDLTQLNSDISQNTSDITQNTSDVSTLKQRAASHFVNFNGTGTVSINDSLNVSSIVDLGSDGITVNFSQSMPSTNYTMASSGTQTFGLTGSASARGETVNLAEKFISSCRVVCSVGRTAYSGSLDLEDVSLAFYHS